MVTQLRTSVEGGTALPMRTGARAISALGAVGALAATLTLFSMGDPLGSTDADELTRALVDNQSGFLVSASLAAYAAAALFVAAARLGRMVGGEAGRVIGAAGAAVGVLLALYLGSFAGGASVAAHLVARPGPGASEATLVLVNGLEFARYGATLALLAATAVVVRRRRGLAIPAIGLALLAATPFTAWIAALVAPVWLGVAGAVVSSGSTADA